MTQTTSHALEDKYDAEDDVKKIQENEESKTSLEKLPTLLQNKFYTFFFKTFNYYLRSTQFHSLTPIISNTWKGIFWGNILIYITLRTLKKRRRNN